MKNWCRRTSGKRQRKSMAVMVQMAVCLLAAAWAGTMLARKTKYPYQGREYVNREILKCAWKLHMPELMYIEETGKESFEKWLINQMELLFPIGYMANGEEEKTLAVEDEDTYRLILKKQAEEAKINALKKEMEEQGLGIHESEGVNTRILGLVGDTSVVDMRHIMANSIVENVQRIQEPYKKANRKFHPNDTVVDVNGVKIGGGNFQVIAGPCSIETKEQITEVANDVKNSGAGLLRGGAFKPRTSPYSFQGLHGEGLELLLEAKKATGLPVVTEIMDASHLPLFEDVDLIQVGSRNMQNFELLKELGKIDKPILLKRGLAATIEEWLMSAEYIMAGGNENVILCERGIRTYETATRNTLDLSAIPVIKKKSHLPVMVDPSHATGIREMVEPLSLAAIAAGADGLMVEVHNNPAKALCDGPQSLTPEQFDSLMNKVNKTRQFFETL